MVKQKKTGPGAALAPAAASAITELPEHLKGKAGKGRGLNNIERTDMILPKIKLIQPLSPEKTEHKIPEGHMMNSLTFQDYGTELEIIVIMHSKGRVCWRKRELGGGVLCASDDNKAPRDLKAAIDIIKKELKVKDPKVTSCLDCPLKDWKDKEEVENEKERKPRCTGFNMFVVVISGQDPHMPIALAMDRTKNKVAKRLMTLAVHSGGGLDIFAKKYRLRSVVERNDQYTYYNYNVEPLGFATADEYKNAEALFESLAKVNVQIEHDQEDAGAGA